MDNPDFSGGFLFGSFVCTIVFMIFILVFTRPCSSVVEKKDVIARGYALYHPVTGEFVWKDDYEKKEKQ